MHCTLHCTVIHFRSMQNYSFTANILGHMSMMIITASVQKCPSSASMYPLSKTRQGQWKHLGRDVQVQCCAIIHLAAMSQNIELVLKLDDANGTQ